MKEVEKELKSVLKTFSDFISTIEQKCDTPIEISVELNQLMLHFTRQKEILIHFNWCKEKDT